MATESISLDGGARGFWMGGNRSPGNDNIIDFVTIPTAGNASDFGDLTVGRTGISCVASITRGVCGLGFVSPANKDEIDYITISTTGNASDFGNLNTASRDGAGVSKFNKRFIFLGRTPSITDEINQITIATTGNAVDFANQVTTTASMGSCESPTRGLAAGGQNSK